MALPDAAMAGDGDRTMAIPDAMAQLRGASGVNIASAPAAAAPAKKSNAGLFVGLGLLAVVGGGIAVVSSQGGKSAEAPAAAVAAAPAEKPKVKLVIRASGAAEVLVDGKPECMSKDVCEVQTELGPHKVIAKNTDGKGVDQQVELVRDGQEVELKVPAVEKKAEAAAAAQGPAVVLRVVPDSAKVSVNGKPVALTAGTGPIPGLKVGDKLIVIASADGHKEETKEFIVKNPSAELFELKLEKSAGGSAPASSGASSSKPKEAAAEPGVVVVRAKPWANVMVKGKSYGETPQNITLPPGKYTVTLKKGSVEKTATATIKSGGRSEVFVDMSEP
jgi:hypothetical protein